MVCAKCSTIFTQGPPTSLPQDQDKIVYKGRLKIHQQGARNGCPLCVQIVWFLGPEYLDDAESHKTLNRFRITFFKERDYQAKVSLISITAQHSDREDHFMVFVDDGTFLFRRLSQMLKFNVISR
jgi:hypothetical protein